MTIRRKLGLSFGVILLLFGLNLAIYFWSAAKRNRTVETLSRAISRETLIASLSQALGNLHQQVTLMSGVSIEAGGASASPEQRQDFANQIERVSWDLAQLDSDDPFVAADSDRQEIKELRNTFEQLARSWKTYYDNFGVSPSVAVVELAVRADPLSEQVLKSQLPHLRQAEQERVSKAKADFARVSRVTDRISVVVFLLSLVVAATIAYLVSRDLAHGLSDLALGTALISAGHLEHRVEVCRNDELAYVAESFNLMAASLCAAQEKAQRYAQEMEESNRELAKSNEEIVKQKQMSENLLRNILPVAVAEELCSKGAVAPKYYEDVTILFTDFVGFTKNSEKLATEDLVYVLHDFFSMFDRVVEKYGLEKLKTIGDSYMCVGGIPTKNSSHPVDSVLAAFDMLEAVAQREVQAHTPWAIRIGIHTGPVAAGVVGIHKFAFDIWSDSVNFAARLQATSQPNRINISTNTYSRVKDFFECGHRGQIETKEKKAFDMYFVNGLHPDLRGGASAEIPRAFARRYQLYFSRLPGGFPASIQQ